MNKFQETMNKYHLSNSDIEKYLDEKLELDNYSAKTCFVEAYSKEPNGMSPIFETSFENQRLPMPYDVTFVAKTFCGYPYSDKDADFLTIEFEFNLPKETLSEEDFRTAVDEMCNIKEEVYDLPYQVELVRIAEDKYFNGFSFKYDDFCERLEEFRSEIPCAYDNMFFCLGEHQEVLVGWHRNPFNDSEEAVFCLPNGDSIALSSDCSNKELAETLLNISEWIKKNPQKENAEVGFEENDKEDEISLQ